MHLALKAERAIGFRHGLLTCEIFRSAKFLLRSMQKNHSSCFPFVSGNCVAMIAVSTNAIAHSRNAALRPFLSPTQPIV
jgi:hypothetical protein